MLNELYTCAHPHCTYGTCGVLHCLLFCDQTRPNLRISLVGYHCAIEFPCGVLLFYCCKYPTTYGVRVHYFTHSLFLKQALRMMWLLRYNSHIQTESCRLLFINNAIIENISVSNVTGQYCYMKMYIKLHVSIIEICRKKNTCLNSFKINQDDSTLIPFIMLQQMKQIFV